MTLRILDLRSDAIVEARRVAEMRRLCRAEDAKVLARVGMSGPVVARARHVNTRRRLAGRLLLVFRIACEDAMGRTLDASLVGVLCTLPVGATARRRACARAALREIEPVLKNHLHALVAPWIGTAASVCDAFAQTLLARLDALQARELRQARPIQPGLFDRRAERAEDIAATSAADRAHHLQTRRRALEQPVVTAQTIDLMLVLTP